MKPKIFANKGKFFRGNLHTHSNLSDGLLSPEEVCKRYKSEGYNFICLSDHLVGMYGYPISDTTNYRDKNFTTILGAEVHSGAMQNGELWHLLAVGLPENFPPPNAPDFSPIKTQESGASLARRCRESGAFVSIAHPSWSGLTIEDAKSIDSAHCVEIYNHGCAVGSDRGDSSHTLDLLLSEGKKLNLIATDDAHFHYNDHFGGWVHVKAEENDPDLLLKSLISGEYFSSQGPIFYNVEVDRYGAYIESSPIDRAIVVGYGSASVAVHGKSMTKTKINFPEHSKSSWIRIIIADSSGKKAWLNPIYEEELDSA
tara:strand:+ start:250 stop:1188 length:939 start_codon:yes stop_codon:yes gene_type:complete